MAYKVSELVKNLNNAIKITNTLCRIELEGEIVGYNGPNRSGHIYFDLKDIEGTAVIKCMMFASKCTREYLEIFRDGARVTLYGSLNYHERFGLSFVFERISDDGEGARKRALEALRREFEELGMFDEMYKKEIPRFPMKVGLITSPVGAAIGDVVTNARDYNPYIQLIVCPALLEGDGAAESVVSAIKRMDEYAPDVIILTRGGGSKDSLWTFNEREVAQAVFDCTTPIVSAIGHDRDRSLTDDIADHYESTPTGAAHCVTENVRDLLRFLEDAPNDLYGSMNRRIQQERKRLKASADAIRFNSPESRLKRDKKELEKYRSQFPSLMAKMLTSKKQQLERYSMKIPSLMDTSLLAAQKKRDVYISRLEGLSPLLRLKSGFSYVSGPDGRNVRSVENVKNGDEIDIRVYDGVITSVVKETEHIEE